QGGDASSGERTAQVLFERAQTVQVRHDDHDRETPEPIGASQIARSVSGSHGNRVAPVHDRIGALVREDRHAYLLRGSEHRRLPTQAEGTNPGTTANPW